MPPTLYHVPKTISSPLVQLILELNLLEEGGEGGAAAAGAAQIHVQEMSFADLKKPEHLAINTMGTSPAFQCTQMGLCMWESGAILDYLLEKHDTNHQFHPPPASATSTPEELRRRTKFLHLKQFILATVYPFLASMYIHTLKSGKMGGGKLDDDYLEAAKQKCHACLGPALAEALGDGPYFLGNDLSAVDLLAAKPLGNADSMGLLLPDFPQLKALLERIRGRPTYRRAYESLEHPIHAVAPAAAAVGVTTTSDGPDDQELILVPKRKDNNNNKEEKENKKPRYHLEEVDC